MKQMDMYLTHVHIYEDGGVGVFNADYLSGGRRYYPALEDAPEDLRRAVAVLRLVAPKTFVDGVGTRMEDNLFWVNSVPWRCGNE